MLCSLHIENIAVIERADIEFTDGFCTLTGETGAGKSILIDSINAVLGERTPKDLIRAGCERAQVVAQFTDLSNECLKALSDLDISDEDGDIIISRVITQSKSVAKVNGVAVPASALKTLAPYLVNIHGQHDSQQLLNPDRHYVYIDLLAKNEELKNEYKTAFSNMQKTRKTLNALASSEEQRERRISVLEYAIDELTRADVKSGEVERLKSRKEEINRNKKAVETLRKIANILDGDNGALSLIDEAVSGLISISNTHADISNSANEMSNARDIIENVVRANHNILSDCYFDEKELDTIDERLDMYFSFVGKYGKNEDEMLEFLSNAKSELESLKNSEKNMGELSEKLQSEVEKVKSLGARLTQSRAEASEKFETDVENELKFLNMPSVKLKVQINQAPYSTLGADKVEFLIRTNSGEQLKPLSKIASGGEMSRIMLAIKCVLSENDPVGTMIFDEIDAGISGEAALKVGDRLKAVAKHRQVICVTHLAQIACMSKLHLLIKKSTDDFRTYTNITPLDDDGRKRELARIIGGNVTDSAISAAEELLEKYKL
ncbi:MAG: DNA repair protein RecN [Acutalibacteraceae bacterium]|nr:DNA repair protein RecN [Acutalibacteraceae bacterium]